MSNEQYLRKGTAKEILFEGRSRDIMGQFASTAETNPEIMKKAYGIVDRIKAKGLLRRALETTASKVL